MTAVETKLLTKKYQNKTAVDNLNLTIESGELFALLGVNGAGKFTTIKMLSCLTAPTSGDALLMGDSIIEAPQKVKARINVSPQETAVASNLTVRENLEFICGIYGHQRKTSVKMASDMIAEFHMGEIERDKAKTLSGGWQRRLSIAMALISQPEIIFLDEPTLGLDVLARRELWKVIASLKGKMTVILTTHYLEEAESLADHIGIMSNGRLVELGTAKELIERSGMTTFEDAFVHFAEESI